jgi:orotidine-5'-phosphate decarboxylase
MTFTEKLKHIQHKNNSLLCIGLDTDIQKIPKHLLKTENPQLEFNKVIIEATKDLVGAYKLNLAFYEEHGIKGFETIQKTLELIPEGVITIADGKRGDIGNSAEKQASAIFGTQKFSAVTVNPYMGFDAVEPFIKQPEKGVFVLNITSNPGSKDFQYLKVNGKPLYQFVTMKCKKWNVNHNIGLVVGATRVVELQKIRSIAPDMPFLIPGVGAQKGDLEASVRYGCSHDGTLAIINIGRSIIYSSMQKIFGGKVREAAKHYQLQINYYREKYYSKILIKN